MSSLTLTLSSKNGKMKINWKENENKNKKTKSTSYDLDSTILLYTAGIDAVNISFDDTSSIVLFPSKAYYLVILNNPNISSSISMLIVSWLYLVINLNSLSGIKAQLLY